MTSTPKRAENSSMLAGAGMAVTRRSGLSASSGRAGWADRKGIMGPNIRVYVQPNRRTSSQNRDTENVG